MLYCRCPQWLKLVAVGVVLAMLAGLCQTAYADEPSLVKDTKPLLERLKGIAKITMAGEFKGGKEYKTSIFVEGYNERAILALYEITGEKFYLDHVRKWVGKLLDLQKPEGYWGTGYGDVYFADTGSALGLLMADEKPSEYLLCNPVAICLAGRAITTVIRPGVDCNRWMDSTRSKGETQPQKN
jgi:hypothetical protein